MAESARYIEAIGRRKTASARIRITPASRFAFLVNSRELSTYFPTEGMQKAVSSPFEKSGTDQKFKVTAIVRGGGIEAQAEAVRHGIARALVEFNHDFRKNLKSAGYLKRDPRMKERRKFGLKKARKAPQWSKR